MRAVRQSPGRARPAEPGSWLPLPDVDVLPELDELFDLDLLVDSGQTTAIRLPTATEAERDPDLDPAVTLIEIDVDAAIADLEREVAALVGPEPAEPDGAGPAARPLATPLEVPPAAPGRSYHPSELVELRAAPVGATAPSRATLARARRSRRARHRAALLATAFAVALLVATAWPRLFGRRETTVRIAVDGVSASHRVRASTVGDALAASGIRLGGFDRVAPSLLAPVRQGTTIAVTRAVPVTVEVDGAGRTVLTSATSVDAVREQLGLRPTLLARGTEVTKGAVLAFRTPRRVTLTVDGSTTASTASARTVAELLADAHVVVGASDIVTPASDTLLTTGTAVQVVRVAGQYTTERRAIPMPVQYVEDGTLPVGQRRTTQPGRAGTTLDTFRLTTHDGQVVDRQKISSVVQQPAVAQVIAVGAKAPAAPRTPPASAAGARSAPTPASAATTHTETGKASWYAFTPGTCAHKTIAKGTVVKVTNTATGVWTTCMVADRGPFGGGRILDLSRDVFAKLAPSTSGVITVRAEW